MIKIMAIVRRCTSWLTPHDQTREGITKAFTYAGWLLLVLLLTSTWWQGASVYTALGLLLAGTILLIGLVVVHLMIKWLATWSGTNRWAALLLLIVLLLPSVGLGPVYFAFAAIFALGIALLGAGVAHLNRVGSHWATWLPLGSGALILCLGIGLLSSTGWNTEPPITWQDMQGTTLDIADPAQRGQYEVTKFTYGPGTDSRRAQFGAEVRFQTSGVDGQKLLQGWEGWSGWARSAFWQAEPENIPVRAQVWMPKGAGPFPVVLMVHGNHSMEDFSDDGYDYLGEHFASHGYIAASVDENMFNSSTADFLTFFDGGLEEENDARAWLLLEHLRQWRDWSNDPDHGLYRRADLERVVLIGHSRGGEAVSEAAVFNQLPAYPDDASLIFDYGFGLAGVIAIAPVDDQYNPRERATTIEGVNYLVIHGSHDSDVDAFVGSATYNRLDFGDCDNCFKNSHYLIGANHGQFNTGWGAYDVPAPFSFFLNVKALIDAEHQRLVAKTLFTAFLEAVIDGDERYQQFLAAPHRAPWMPENTQLLSNFLHASDQVLADYEEDANVTTATQQGVEITSRGLALWREQEVPLKWSETDTAMVLVGWDDKKSDAERSEYTLTFKPPLMVATDEALAFALAMSEEAPGEVDDYEVPQAIDFSIELIDANTQKSSLLLSKRRPLLPQIDAPMYKLRGLNSNAGSEVVMQRYRFGFDEFVSANPQIDLQAVHSVRIRFDQTSQGSLWLDDLNISKRGH